MKADNQSRPTSITRRTFASIAVTATGTSAPGMAGAQTQQDTQAPGSVFHSGKPYFPMLLGNGREHVLIGYTGSMGACAGHEHWAYGTIENRVSVTGWFRPDTRTRPSRGVLNLLQCGYILQQGVHADGLDSAEQVFDPTSGVLITECHFANAELRVRTFLTATSRLVHRFTVVSAPESMQLQFFVRAPRPDEPLELTATESSDASALSFLIRGENWPDTAVRLYSDHPNTRKVTCYNREPGIAAPLTRGSEFAFVVECSDASSSRSTPQSPTRLAKMHEAEWQHYDSRSSVHLARSGLENIYRTSLYIVRAHQHPEMGGITVGSYPGMWSNGINSYDVSYDFMALLGANRIAEAEQVVGFWKRILPILRERAATVDLPGVACPAPMSPWGESPPKSRESLLEERHFITANIALHVWQLYRYTGRLSVLRDYWDCIVQPLEFLLGACVDEFPDHAEIIRSSGPNGKERINGKVVYQPNPIRTLLATIEAVRGAIQGARLLERAPDPQWTRLLPKLEQGIEANRFDGVVRTNRTPDAPPRADASYVGLFNCLTDQRTLNAEIEHATGPEGYMRWPDHGYLAIPWSHTNVSATYSRLGLPGAASMLEMAARFTTTLQGIPEAVRPDGVFHKIWYPTVHGGFVHAMNLLLLCPRDDALHVFSAVPEDWGDVEFRSLRVPPGLLVAAARSGGRVTAEVTNDSEQQQRADVRAPGWEETLSLEPGETVKLPRR